MYAAGNWRPWRIYRAKKTRVPGPGGGRRTGVVSRHDLAASSGGLTPAARSAEQPRVGVERAAQPAHVAPGAARGPGGLPADGVPRPVDDYAGCDRLGRVAEQRLRPQERAIRHFALGAPVAERAARQCAHVVSLGLVLRPAGGFSRAGWSSSSTPSATTLPCPASSAAAAQSGSSSPGV